MKHHKFGKTSEENLKQVHPALVKVARRALELSQVDFGITCGVRSMVDQADRVADGDSGTMNSRHVVENNDCKMACAVDAMAYVDGKGTWEFWTYRKIAKAFFRAAIENGVQIEWGGFWRKPKDGPHFQLSWREYP